MKLLYFIAKKDAVNNSIHKFSFKSLFGQYLKVLTIVIVLQSLSPSISYSQTGLQFNGTNEYVTFGVAPSLATQNFTVEAWFKRTGTGTSNSTGTGGLTIIPILTKGSPEAENSVVDANYILGINASLNVIAADFEEGTGSTSPGLNHPLSGTTVIVNNIWYHAAATFSNGVFSIYLNGVLENSVDFGLSVWPQGASTQHAAIGTMIRSNGTTVAGFFAGVVDEARIWDNARSQSMIHANMNVELISGTGLLGRWGLNDGAGTTAANSIGGGPAGALMNTPTWVTGITFPPELWALKFNGTDQHVTFGAAPELNTTAFTLEAWIKIEGAGSTTVTSGSGGGGFEGATAAIPILTKGRGESESPDNINMNYFLGLVGDKLAADFEIAAGQNYSVIGNTSIPSNTWTHVAATYEPVSGVWNLYINGVLDKTLDIGDNIFPVSTSIQHAGIATAFNSSGVADGHFNGSVDEARIWNVARTAVEIQTTINQELTSSTGLIGRWALDEGSGTSITNSIGTPNGTLENNPSWVFGAPFNILFTAPADPSGLAATATSPFQINLTWNDNSTNEISFEIERSTTGIGGAYTLLTTVPVNSTSYFDNTVTATTEYCYRVRAINGTGNSAYSNSICATTPAVGDNALNFGSAGAYVTFDEAAGLSTQNFTVEAWFKKTGAGTANTTGTGGIVIIPIVSKGAPQAEGSNVDANYILGIESGTNVIAADFEEGTGSTSPGLNHPLTGTTVITDNVWHHAAVTFENGVYKIYLDGLLENSIDLTSAVYPQGASIQHAALGTMIRTDGTTALGKFDGTIDEARIWNYGRSLAQIQSTANSQITTAQAGLIARWGLNEGAGTIINGTAGTSFTGNIINSGWSWVTPGAPFNLTFTIPTFVGLQDGLNGYTGTRDTYTYDVDPATVRGAETTIIQDINTGDERRSLLKFDLSTIPSTATIQSAEFVFYVDTEGQGFNMHRMLVPWDEATTSFTSIGNRHYAADNTDAESTVNANWPGVDTYVGLDSVIIPASTIQDWVNTPASNNGWLMIATHASDGQQLASREYATVSNRPRLKITYTNTVANLPPDVPTNPSPANNATSGTINTILCTTVSDPEASSLTVKFYGRKKVNSGAKFSIIALPDTQFYTEEPQGQNSGGGGHNGIFKAQTQWIADHRIDSSIAFVIQLGDCVQNGDANEIEWKRADTSMKKIENPAVPITDGIPYGICVGNHDQGPIADPDGTTNFYNQYFGEARFIGRAYYGGHYGSNNDNHYELFSAGGIDFINISIEYYANGTTASLQPVLDWADALLKAYPTRKGIISTHNMLNTAGNFQGPGQKIYDDLKDNPNLILMLCGHVAGEGRRTDTFNGNTIHTVLADFQSGYSNGGDGLLRIMQFDPSANQINVKTYSPYSNTSRTGTSSQFTLSTNLSESFQLIGTNTNVASGSQTCMSWPNLDPNSDYEWYVEVSDGVNTTTGSVWTFTTFSNAPLPVNIVSFKAKAENNDKVKISWTTSYENDNSFFDIQRSSDGLNFSTIGTTPGKNNSNSLQDYTFYDNMPIKGISFYRLKQVDVDAKSTYSRIERINISDSKNNVDIYPNPVIGNNFSINLRKEIVGVIDIKIYDMKGSLLFLQQSSGANTILVNHQLPKGIYTVKISSNEFVENKKIVIH